MSNFFSYIYKHIFLRCFFISLLTLLVFFVLDFVISLITESSGFSMFQIQNTVIESFEGLLSYFEMIMLLSVLITLSIFKQANNIVILQSFGQSPLKISMIAACAPLILSFLFIGFSLLIPSNDVDTYPQWELEDQSISVLQKDKVISIDFSSNKINKVLSTTPNDLSANTEPSSVLQKMSSRTLSLPFATLALVLLASIFLYKHQRNFSISQSIFFGIAAGFGYKLISDLFYLGFRSFDLNINLGIFIPPTIALCFSVFFFLRLSKP